jgi:hypothetical protein
MKTSLRTSFWLSTAGAAISTVLAIVTLFLPAWIEAIFGVDPDRHNGSLEWVIVGVLLVAAGVLGSISRGEWRRASALPH